MLYSYFIFDNKEIFCSVQDKFFDIEMEIKYHRLFWD